MMLNAISNSFPPIRPAFMVAHWAWGLSCASSTSNRAWRRNWRWIRASTRAKVMSRPFTSSKHCSPPTSGGCSLADAKRHNDDEALKACLDFPPDGWFGGGAFWTTYCPGVGGWGNWPPTPARRCRPSCRHLFERVTQIEGPRSRTTVARVHQRKQLTVAFFYPSPTENFPYVPRYTPPPDCRSHGFRADWCRKKTTANQNAKERGSGSPE
jgi:hypothetical protein